MHTLLDLWKAKIRGTARAALIHKRQEKYVSAPPSFSRQNKLKEQTTPAKATEEYNNGRRNLPCRGFANYFPSGTVRCPDLGLTLTKIYVAISVVCTFLQKCGN